jgi:hypothetical protein
MTGVLKARVGGSWVDVSPAVPSTDEVWVGPDDPGLTSPYEVWYDTDDDTPQYGSYAQGVTNVGAFNIANGTAMPTSGATLVATVSNFYYTSGRRYRLFIELNAGIASGASAGNGNYTLSVDGVDQPGGVWQIYQQSMHQHFSYEFYLEKYGMSVGLHTLRIYYTHAAGGQVTLHTDNGTVEVRDTGPSNPMNPLTATTPPAWIPLPFATGWSSYDTTYQSGGYRKLGDMVFLRGLCTQVAGATSSMFTLPSGYRPLKISLGAHISSVSMVRYDIQTNGSFVTSATISSGNWVSLEGIQFSVTPG